MIYQTTNKTKTNSPAENPGVFKVSVIVVLVFLFCVLSVQADAQDTRQQAVESDRSYPTGRVVGGTVSDGYPWMVAVLEAGITDTFFAQICGGTLIASRWVMTAAHCLSSSGSLTNIRPANQFEVLIGQARLGGVSPSRIAVRNVHKHPDYENFLFPDIALLELAEAALAQPLRMEPASGTHDNPGNTGTVAGWGWQSETGPSSDRLLEADVPITTQAVCQRAYGDSEPIVKSAMVCAGFQQGGVDACAGDSGGPLFVTDERSLIPWLVGVVSFGAGCARPNTPGVYARVSSFTMWARGIMGNELASVSGENRLAAEFSVSCNLLRCVIDGLPSTEGPNQITLYRWSLGDEAVEYGRRIVHVYKDPGEYFVKLTITDARGRERNITKRIRVVSDRPQFHRVSKVWRNRLAEGDAVLVPDSFGFYAQPGRVLGLLDSDASNFNLILQYHDEAAGRWITVSRSTGPSSNELIRFDATRPGYYRWRVQAARGAGVYYLRTNFL